MQVYLLSMADEIAVTDADPTAALDDETSPEAPFGWMTDPVTGQRRPRKRRGRRPKTVRMPSGPTPPVEQLQALGSLPEAAEDTAPGEPPKATRKAFLKADSPSSTPPYRAGTIAKTMNSLYRRAGRFVRLWDMDLGNAVIACTRAEDDDDRTVGDAWENLAKTNPRIKAFLLRLMTGGAWTELFLAHMPMLMALAMKENVRRHIPFMGVADVLLTDEPDEPGGMPGTSGLAQMMGGINPDDMAQMMQMAQGFMGQMANGVPRQPGMPRDPAAGQD